MLGATESAFADRDRGHDQNIKAEEYEVAERNQQNDVKQLQQ
jgi:hypothetical protein